MKKAYITFRKNGKVISKKDFEVCAEEWRKGVKGAEMIAHLQTHWFYLPTSCSVVLDGYRYYFRIGYTDRKEQSHIVHLPNFTFTTKRRA